VKSPSSRETSPVHPVSTLIDLYLQPDGAPKDTTITTCVSGCVPAHNTTNTDTPFVDIAKLNLGLRNSCVRSIAFAARRIDFFIGGKSNGGVCRDCLRNVKSYFVLSHRRTSTR
jgi:hypothetical protein